MITQNMLNPSDTTHQGDKLNANFSTLYNNIGQVKIVVRGLNLNAAGDTIVPVNLPAGYTRYQFNSMVVCHASLAPSTATLGLYTAASAGGVALVSTAALAAITATADNTAANMLNMTVADTTESITAPNLYLHVGTAQGAACTVDVVIVLTPLS